MAGDEGGLEVGARIADSLEVAGRANVGLGQLLFPSSALLPLLVL